MRAEIFQTGWARMGSRRARYSRWKMKDYEEETMTVNNSELMWLFCVCVSVCFFENLVDILLDDAGDATGHKDGRSVKIIVSISKGYGRAKVFL